MIFVLLLIYSFLSSEFFTTRPFYILLGVASSFGIDKQFLGGDLMVSLHTDISRTTARDLAGWHEECGLGR